MYLRACETITLMTAEQELKDNYLNPLRKRFTSQFFSQITQTSGVYFMLDPRGSILYIGKAKNLRNRIRSYSHLKPGRCPDHTLEMLEQVNSIQWKECPSEKDAFSKENELLHAIRPPYNIASTEIEHYLFIGIRENLSSTKIIRNQPFIKLDFQLSSHSKIANEGYRIYGCFKNRKNVKAGYTALLRLVFAATINNQRFCYPARITRSFPPWQYASPFPKDWLKALHRFLDGEAPQLLHDIVEALLENENVPEFMRQSIQDDISIVRIFYEIGPQFTSKVKKVTQSKNQILLQTDMEQFFAAEARFSGV